MTRKADTAHLEDLRKRLCDLQTEILHKLVEKRAKHGTEGLAEISATTAADVIYAVDTEVEELILAWLKREWPQKEPLEVVMEGLEEHGVVTFPEDTAPEDTLWKLIFDPIDGTRCLMYDKRSAWALCGLAPQKGPDNTLRDICVAVMTELPTTRSWRADQISGTRSKGDYTLTAEAINVMQRDFPRERFTLRPFEGQQLEHGFGSFVQVLPEGKALLAQAEGALWERLGLVNQGHALLFHDQYICTGGQFFGILNGTERFLADLRHLMVKKLGFNDTLCCHPYDACTWPLLEATGAIIENADGSPLNGPLDTTTSMGWVGFPNPALRELIRPHLDAVIEEFLT